MVPLLGVAPDSCCYHPFSVASFKLSGKHLLACFDAAYSKCSFGQSKAFWVWKVGQLVSYLARAVLAPWLAPSLS